MKKLFLSFALSMSLMFSVGITGAYATNSIDQIHSNKAQVTESSSNSGNSSSDKSQSSGTVNQPTSEVDNNNSVSGYFKNYKPVTDENMASASKLGSPIVAIFGNIIGFILIVTTAGIFVVTALDLAYIGLPIVRPYLAPQASAQGGGMGMGGMGMGMHSSGGGQPQGKQWVSDEALRSVQSMSGGSGGMAGGMGMGVGMGMGGMGMGMPSGGQQGGDTKSVILTYFKKRMFFLIVFGVASVMLTSSVFLDCGINVAQLGFKVMASINQAIQGIY